MKIMYITANVLGDSGANAAELFPKFANQTPEIDHVIIADFYRNKDFIKYTQGGEYLRLRSHLNRYLCILLNAVRISRICKRFQIDTIHVFYRQSNVPLIILIRILLTILNSRTKILLDHRSVNLAKGFRNLWKKSTNQIAQMFVHELAGNPLATETNYYKVFKNSRIIDLGYDKIPGKTIETPKPSIWFVGSMKPPNRRPKFLIELFDAYHQRHGSNPEVTIRVAGAAKQDHVESMLQNPAVTYYGRLNRSDLYMLMQTNPGVGIAYMHKAHHDKAPSLKYCEYAAMGFQVVASNNEGLKIQCQRMEYGNTLFADETIPDWLNKLDEAAKRWTGKGMPWPTMDHWSYQYIYQSQVIPIYQSINNKTPSA